MKYLILFLLCLSYSFAKADIIYGLNFMQKEFNAALLERYEHCISYEYGIIDEACVVRGLILVVCSKNVPPKYFIECVHINGGFDEL